MYAHYHTAEYSVVCMPFFGTTTLAHLLDRIQKRSAMPKSGSEILETMRHCRAEAFSSTDSPTTPAVPSDGIVAAAEPIPATGMPLSPAWKVLEKYSYVEAVLWIMARVAAGLAHAHARGILHRDLKPANILLSDDGEPLLLDLSSAEDTKVQNEDTGHLLGGTLLYLAPEHLQAFQEKRVLLDERGDIYALGVILYELLGGRLPHPLREGPRDVVILGMIEDRRLPAASIRNVNRDVSPAAAAILHRCLANDPIQRYQKAADLQEDLERQLEARPLCT
jgi:serine/threonine protein kinase